MLFVLYTEADPIYSFLKPMAKRYEGYVNREIELECVLSSSRAMVTWYRGDKALQDGNDYEINKDAIGTCRLTIKKPNLKSTGDYKCKIDKQEDTTKTHLTVVGMNSNHSLITIKINKFFL